MKRETIPASVYVHATIAGTVLFLWYMVCFWGMPFDFSADLLYIYDMAKKASVGTLMRGIINPLTPAWFFSDDMIGLRPGHILFLKMLYMTGNLFLPISFLVAFSGVALLSAALFLVLWYACRSKGFAWLGVLLYGTFPSQVYCMISIFAMDFRIFELVFMLCVVLLFWKILQDVESSPGRFCMQLASVVLMTWLTIKFKSAAKVLPCILLVLLFVSWARSYRATSWPRTIATLAVVLAMFILVIPFIQHLPPSHKEQYTLQPSLKFAMQRIFQSQPGSVFQLLTSKRVPPGSLTENYGFFLGWIFWLALAAGLLSRITGKTVAGARNGTCDLFWPAFIWFCFALAGFALGEPPLDANNRYLNYGLLPSILLFFACLFPLLRPADVRGAWAKRTGQWILVVLFGITIAQNSLLFTGWVQQLAGFQWALVQAESEIFTQVYHRAPETHEELWRLHPIIRAQNICVEWEGEEPWSKKENLYYLARSDQKGEDALLKEKGMALVLRKKISLYDAPIFLLQCANIIRTLLDRKGKGKDIFIYSVVRQRQQNTLTSGGQEPPMTTVATSRL